jgi:hypothetical protein
MNRKFTVLWTMILSFIILSGAQCTSKNGNEPYIRTQPGIEYCGTMCQKFESLNCTGYYEDIDLDCSTDPIYMTMQQCQVVDGGIAKLSCVELCEYQMTNSVQLNPQCLSENLLSCSEIETICIN